MRKERLTVFGLYFLVCMAGALMLLLVNNRADWDLWGVMSFGALLEQNPGFFPYHDMFSYTAFGDPWVYHEWGSGVVFYQLLKHLGSPALFWLKMILMILILLLACHRVLWTPREGQPLSGFQSVVFNLTLLPAVYLILPLCSITIRCHMFSFLGFALFLWLLETWRLKHRHRLLWLFPPLMVIWVNLHGGFITGLAAIGTYWLASMTEKRWPDARRLGICLLLCLLAVLINPYGMDFVTTMISAWSLPRSHISEWGNVFTLDIPHYNWLYPLLFVVAVGLGVRHWLGNRRRFPVELVLLLLTGIEGMRHHKLCPFFLITLLSLGPNLLPSLEGKIWRPGMQALWRFLKPVYTSVLPVLLILPLLVLTVMYQMVHPESFKVRVPGPEAEDEGPRLKLIAYPLGAAGFIKVNHIQGNLWAPFQWGEFLYWTLTPDIRISIDGRYETVYSQKVFHDFRAFYMGEDKLEAAFRYPTTLMLVPTDRSRLFEALKQHAEWHPVYGDSQVVLFSRRPRPDYVPVAVPPSLHLDNLLGDLTRFRQPDSSSSVLKK